MASKNLVSSFLRGICSLLFPARCIGCGEEGRYLCAWCFSQVTSASVQTEHYRQLLRVSWVFSAAPYEGVARACVLAAKHDSQISPSLWVSVVGDYLAEQIWGALKDYSSLYLVPAPSGWKRRLAGRYVAAELAHAVARSLVGIAADLGEPFRVEVVCALSMPPWISGQAGRNGSERFSRVGKIRAHGLSVGPGAQVVLIDDVIASGGTIKACLLALGELGIKAIGVAVACSSQRRTQVENSSISETSI